MITTQVGGTYSRVADPDWDDPLDTDFSFASGGRWNAPGTFPVLYLNETLGAARANVSMRLAEQRRLGITLDMLDPWGLPVLVDVLVSPGTAVSGLQQSDSRCPTRSMLRVSKSITHTAGQSVRRPTRHSIRASERGARRSEQAAMILSSRGSATTVEAQN